MSGLNSFGWYMRFGAVLGLLAYGVGLPLFLEISILAALVLSASFGAVVGAMCSVLVSFMFQKRDFGLAEPAMVWTTAALISAISFFAGDNVFLLMFASAAAFILTAATIVLLTPRIWSEPGLCRRCGFDLRGSKEFGRCPECGTGLGPSVDATSVMRGLPAQRKKWSMRGRPLRLLFVIVVILLAYRGYGDWVRRDRTARLVAAVIETRASRSFVDLSEFGPRRFDRVFVFGPYTDERTIQVATGTKFQLPSMSTHDDSGLILYVRGGRVVEILVAGFAFDAPNPTCTAGMAPDAAFLRITQEGAAECRNVPP